MKPDGDAIEQVQFATDDRSVRLEATKKGVLNIALSVLMWLEFENYSNNIGSKKKTEGFAKDFFVSTFPTGSGNSVPCARCAVVKCEGLNVHLQQRHHGQRRRNAIVMTINTTS